MGGEPEGGTMKLVIQIPCLNEAEDLPATLDDPDLIPAQAQIQTAERIGWMEKLNDLPAFERYPPFE